MIKQSQFESFWQNLKIFRIFRKFLDNFLPGKFSSGFAKKLKVKFLPKIRREEREGQLNERGKKLVKWKKERKLNQKERYIRTSHWEDCEVRWRYFGKSGLSIPKESNPSRWHLHLWTLFECRLFISFHLTQDAPEGGLSGFGERGSPSRLLFIWLEKEKTNHTLLVTSI